jgi:pimeloyl-ACP methyl ester carboxylesterase
MKAHTVTYDGASHAPFWEAPERFNRELRALREGG